VSLAEVFGHHNLSSFDLPESDCQHTLKLMSSNFGCIAFSATPSLGIRLSVGVVPPHLQAEVYRPVLSAIMVRLRLFFYRRTMTG
jgi:hypothetical protein